MPESPLRRRFEYLSLKFKPTMTSALSPQGARVNSGANPPKRRRVSPISRSRPMLVFCTETDVAEPVEPLNFKVNLKSSAASASWRRRETHRLSISEVNLCQFNVDRGGRESEVLNFVRRESACTCFNAPPPLPLPSSSPLPPLPRSLNDVGRGRPL